jgi:16S rRNA (adenine(1408)-N(1))-methyltransferase
VLAAAAARPDTLAIGVDANAAGMADSSRRASRRDALPNALFVVAAAESPPDALRGLAGSLTVHFPWGSLLRGLLGRDDAVLGGVAQLLAPGAEGSALLSVVPRDGVPPVPPWHELADAYSRHGLDLTEARPATGDEVAASRSSWAKRLRAGVERPVTLLRLRRPAYDAHVKRINCVCGYLIEAEDEDELFDKVQEHLRVDHPELVGKVSREDILAQAEEA